MSVVSSLLPFFLLCLTYYGCNASRMGIMDRESSRLVQLPGQNMEKAIDDKTPIPLKVKLSMSEEVQTRGKRLVDVNTKKLNDTQALAKGVEERRETISVWNVPHEKHRELPALNMDYSPPEASPPLHN